MSDRTLVKRRCTGSIIHPGLSPSIGTNICGPSLIKTPPWLADPQSRYMLYFADHRGKHIRLAFADNICGPWRIHEPGCLHVSQSQFCTEQPATPSDIPGWAKNPADWLYPHIASPDVHVDHEREQVRMYFHGLMPNGEQMTRVAISDDGQTFSVRPDLLGPCYFRVFQYGGDWYALVMPGQLLRSADGLSNFKPGTNLLPEATRHTAVVVSGDQLHVFWTQIGDVPERIYRAQVALDRDWTDWQLSSPEEVLRPRDRWEGGHLPLAPSRVGAADTPENALRDPCIFVGDEATWLLYSGAGEGGIGAVEITL